MKEEAEREGFMLALDRRGRVPKEALFGSGQMTEEEMLQKESEKVRARNRKKKPKVVENFYKFQIKDNADRNSLLNMRGGESQEEEDDGEFGEEGAPLLEKRKAVNLKKFQEEVKAFKESKMKKT